MLFNKYNDTLLSIPPLKLTITIVLSCNVSFNNFVNLFSVGSIGDVVFEGTRSVRVYSEPITSAVYPLSDSVEIIRPSFILSSVYNFLYVSLKNFDKYVYECNGLFIYLIITSKTYLYCLSCLSGIKINNNSSSCKILNILSSFTISNAISIHSNRLLYIISSSIIV